MEKRGALLLMVILVTLIMSLCISCSLVKAQYEADITKAFMWLESKTADEGWPRGLTIEKFVFSFLALNSAELLSETSKQAALSNFTAKGFQNKICWPRPCKLKESALAKLMLNAAGRSTEGVDEWLLNKTISYTEVDWYLQLISDTVDQKMECQLKYDNEEKIIAVDEKGAISNDPGICFELADYYWLKLNQLECTNKTFEITCDASFKANFLFKKGDNWYVTEQMIPSEPVVKVYNLFITPPIAQCIESAIVGKCDYEATAWTAYAFTEGNQRDKIRDFLPYLVLEKDANERFLPEAFLCGLGLGCSGLGTIQGPDNLWLANNSAYNEFYDTALAGIMSAKQAGDWPAAEKALFKKQSKKGYWRASISPNPVRDTAMILYALLPRELVECIVKGYSCVDNCTALDGILRDYDCPEGECCQLISGEEECEAKYGSCKVSCAEDEAKVEYGCPEGKRCCKKYSKSMCETEIKGKKCSAGQKCVKDGFVISFITAGDTNYCCLGECITPTQTCSELGGIICNSSEGFSCANKWLPAVDSDICCLENACTQVLKSCSAMGCIICEEDQICKDGTPIIAKDTAGQATCCVSGKCILKACPGQECETDEICDGTLVEAADVARCCLDGDCLKSCSALGGEPCPAPRICKQPIQAGDITVCCHPGKCVKKKGFSFWLLILILIALGLVLFLFMRRRKRKKRPPAMIRPGMPPAMRPGIRMVRPARPGAPVPVPRPPLPKAIAKPTKPMPAIKPAFPVKPKPTAAGKPAKPGPKKLKQKRKAVLEELEKLGEE